MYASLFAAPLPQDDPGTGGWEALTAIGWVDITAVVVVLLFFVLGLFKGMVWQLSRIATLIAAYVVAGMFGPDVARTLSGWMHEPPATEPQEQLALYLSYVAIFIAVLIVLSLIAVLVQKLVKRAGLSYYDRLGGAVLGVATGAGVVLALLGAVLMFFPRDGQVVSAAEQSQSVAIGRKALGMMAAVVPAEYLDLFGVERPPDPAEEPPAPGTGEQGR